MSDRIYADTVIEGLRHLDAFSQAWCGGPASFYADRLQQYVDGLFSFAPWKAGDRAEIVKEIPIDKSSGWWSHRHNLQIGQTGTITQTDYIDGKFVCYFEPDDQTWFDLKGVERPVQRPSVFRLAEGAVEVRGEEGDRNE